MSKSNFDNCGEPGPQAEGVNHQETPLRKLQVTHRASSCAKRGGHVQLCSKPRGARVIEPKTFRRRVKLNHVLRPLDRGVTCMHVRTRSWVHVQDQQCTHGSASSVYTSSHAHTILVCVCHSARTGTTGSAILDKLDTCICTRSVHLCPSTATSNFHMIAQMQRMQPPPSTHNINLQWLQSSAPMLALHVHTATAVATAHAVPGVGLVTTEWTRLLHKVRHAYSTSHLSALPGR